MDNQIIRWALAGGKPQAVKLVICAIQKNLPPEFIVPASDLPAVDLAELSLLAQESNIPMISFSDISSEHLSKLDFLLTCRFSLLPKEIYTLPRLGTVNFHNSLLPQYRGTHPVSWAMINDERETGVTLHLLSDKPDAGPILFQDKIEISDSVNLWQLTEILDNLSCCIFERFLEHVSLHKELPIMRQQHGNSSLAPRRHPADSRIDFNLSARHIVKLIKALPAPLPAAFCLLNNTPVSFSDAELAEEFFSERCSEGTVQAKIGQNIYVVKAKNSFIKVFSDFDIPIGAILT